MLERVNSFAVCVGPRDAGELPCRAAREDAAIDAGGEGDSGGTASDWTGARSDRVCTSRVKCGRSEGAGVVDPWEAGLGETSEMI